jgi:hypothetical protein
MIFKNQSPTRGMGLVWVFGKWKECLAGCFCDG